ncbi:hypothetical protein ACIHFD_19100 [Nonomuraea sp. NPDC051941]|uniref:hypothetical protein n=1 Tax=Nonomuraea sp. NPDC051941 TaxID=3364373 RepID=UPI0037C5588C
MAAPRDEATSVSVIHQALDLGVTLIDTADVYGPPHQRGTPRTGPDRPPRPRRARHHRRHGPPRRRPDRRRPGPRRRPILTVPPRRRGPVSPGART